MINRENYEEFFLLYVDGELSAAEKQAVELFVQEHTDLAFELDLLKQLQLTTENIEFPAKSLLYHHDLAATITPEIEEQVLLYIDNELDQASHNHLAKLIAEIPAYQKLHAELSQTKLPIEKIEFVDKQSLFREEKKPIAYFQWWRIAAAASVIGFAFLLWTRLSNEPLTKQSVAKIDGKVKSSPKVYKNDFPSIADNQENSKLTKGPTKQIIQKNNSFTTESAPLNSSQELLAKTESPLNEKNSLPANNMTVPTQSSNALAEDKVTENPATELAKTVNNEISAMQALPAAENSENHSIARSAVYKELDTDDEKKSLYLGSLEINKDKLRGFFRKATSLFRSKAKQEEDGKTESNSETATRTLK